MWLSCGVRMKICLLFGLEKSNNNNVASYICGVVQICSMLLYWATRKGYCGVEILFWVKFEIYNFKLL